MRYRTNLPRELLNVCDYMEARREPIEIPLDARLWELIREAASELIQWREAAQELPK